MQYIYSSSLSHSHSLALILLRFEMWLEREKHWVVRFECLKVILILTPFSATIIFT